MIALRRPRSGRGVRSARPRSMTSQLMLDPVLAAESEFADRDYAPYANLLDINPNMFRRYTTPDDLSDWRQLSSLLAIAPTFGEVREVAIRQPSLENLFIKLTGRALRE